MDFTDRALILRVGRFRESDIWVRLMTPSRGVLQAFAFGGSRSRRRFCGCLDTFNQVLFTFRGSRGGRYLYLTEGTLLDVHAGLRAEPSRLGVARNCADFFELVSLGPAGSGRAYDLLSEALAAASDGVAPAGLFPICFRARLAFDQGFLPPLWICSECGAELPCPGAARFDLRGGRLYCADCAAVSGAARGAYLPCGGETSRLARAVMEREPREWKALAAGPDARREFFDIVDRFVRFHLGVGYEDGGFRRL
ncbi:MAG: recombination protein O N-terminal domain-containing protein [Desulfovibrionaceae bacterium]|nr:recombination protein O N-terminal domain-containing protein [Desulfovibrionaceae bacterium]MBF0513607.1 recombination protein O N-terminal domain-containing protein [Desulfovibrionaceae bacterium]